LRTLRITDSVRQELKIPVGKLVEGKPADCNEALVKAIKKAKPSPTILVGDTITKNAEASGISADVVIFDNVERRRKSTHVVSPGERNVFHLRNAPGTIDAAAWGVVRAAIQKPQSAVIVEGEEDLLTLVAIAVAPIGSLVAYGQPDNGIVIITVSDVEKKLVERIIKNLVSIWSA